MPRAGGKTLARNLLPWMIAVVALTWVFRSVEWHRLADAFTHLPMGRFVLTSVVLLIANCAADCLAMYFTFTWFGCRIPYRELFIVRSATYLLAVVQYYVGQAAIIGFLHQRKGVPGWRAAGFILFISGINMGVLILLASVGLATGDLPIAWLRWVPIAVGSGAIGYGILLRLRPQRLAKSRFFAPLFEMGISGHLKAVAIRIPHVLVLVLWHYLSLWMFHVEVPALAALVYLPAVFFAGALPISIQGLGLAQASAVYFFSRYAGGNSAPVLAYSLAMTAVSLITQVSLGLLFLTAGRRLGVREESAMVVAEGTNEF